MLAHLCGAERGRPGRPRVSWKAGGLVPVDAFFRAVASSGDQEPGRARGRKRAASRDRSCERREAETDEPSPKSPEAEEHEDCESEPRPAEGQRAVPAGGKTERQLQGGQPSEEAESPVGERTGSGRVREEKLPDKSVCGAERKMGKPELQGVNGRKNDSTKNKEKGDQGSNVKGATKGEGANKGTKTQIASATPIQKHRGQIQSSAMNRGGSPPGKRSCSQSTPPGYSSNVKIDYESAEEDQEMEETLQSSNADLLSTLDPSMQALIKLLPTRKDLDTILNVKLETQTERLEQFVEQKVGKVQEEVTKMSTKLTGLEEDMKKLKEIINDTVDATQETKNAVSNLAFQVLDLENRNRRDNVRIRGIPEAIGPDELNETVLSIFNHYLDRPSKEPIKIDRMHRVAVSRNARGGPPRDVICKLHHFPQKEAIIRGGWEKGPIEVRGAQVIILQDLAPKTLQMRKILKPLLEIARSKDIVYRWGFPFSLTLRKENRSFTLRTPAQLQGAFRFLDSPPIEITDWMAILVDGTIR